VDLIEIGKQRYNVIAASVLNQFRVHNLVKLKIFGYGERKNPSLLKILFLSKTRGFPKITQTTKTKSAIFPKQNT